MAKYIYPAIFTKEDRLYSVHFPDLEGCYTQGETLQEAFEMASDVLCLTLYNLEEEKQHIPAASEVKSVQAGENEFVSLISCDTKEMVRLIIRRKIDVTAPPTAEQEKMLREMDARPVLQDEDCPALSEEQIAALAEEVKKARKHR